MESGEISPVNRDISGIGYKQKLHLKIGEKCTAYQSQVLQMFLFFNGKKKAVEAH